MLVVAADVVGIVALVAGVVAALKVTTLPPSPMDSVEFNVESVKEHSTFSTELLADCFDVFSPTESSAAVEVEVVEEVVVVVVADSLNLL